MVNIREIYQNLCEEFGIPFEVIDNVKSYDDSTLFCPAGMQKYKNVFIDVDTTGLTVGNIQSCLRLNDLSEIHDDTHYLYFNMIGLFSFRHWSVQDAINFFLEFLNRLELKPDYVTIHPDKYQEWKDYYDDIEIRTDTECIWSDGEIGGYCTEFYINNVEVGNIVNTIDTCIDVGFGYERLESFINKTHKTAENVLISTIESIIKAGIKPGPKKEEYVLRKLIYQLIQMGSTYTNDYIQKERERIDSTRINYDKLKDKYQNKNKEWWWDTHGIDLNLLNT